MLILNAADVRRALPMRDAVEGMKRALAAVSAGRVQMPLRTHLDIERSGGATLVMPAFLDDESPSLAVKVVSVFPGNRDRGLPSIQAAVLVCDPETGRPEALLEGATLTAIRTAAASGAATDVLARRDSRTLAILGAGVQARTHLEAVCSVRSIESVEVFGPTRENVDALIAETSDRVDAQLTASASARDAVRDADIVCCCTTSPAPVFDDADLKPGAHVTAVGSYKPEVRELPASTVARAYVVVDQRSAAWSEAGDLIQAAAEGLIDRETTLPELGEIISGHARSRETEEEITLFKSVGLAAQDAVAASLVMQNAKTAGLGTRVDW